MDEDKKGKKKPKETSPKWIMTIKEIKKIKKLRKMKTRIDLRDFKNIIINKCQFLDQNPGVSNFRFLCSNQIYSCKHSTRILSIIIYKQDNWKLMIYCNSSSFLGCPRGEIGHDKRHILSNKGRKKKGTSKISSIINVISYKWNRKN